MPSFEYNGKSTEDIIGVPLQLVAIDNVDSLGMNRSKIEGDRTISRPITNEYGTIYDPLSFNYGLIKSDKSIFTEQEQITIEAWLTSPKLSSKLAVTDCNGNQYYYFGLFDATNWMIGDGGYAIVSFTFNVNGAYAYKHFEQTYSPLVTYDEKGDVVFVGSGFTKTINCDTDEYEEYTYPILEISPLFDNYEDEIITITNQTDNYNSVSIKPKQLTTIYMDCRNCIIGNYIDTHYGRIEFNQYKYKDIGWEDVGNIYWPRLLPGKNVIRVDGKVNLKISFDTPHKKVGGWLI